MSKSLGNVIDPLEVIDGCDLKHLQDNVREVRTGFEFGVSADNWNNFKEGDIVEFFVTQRVEQ